MTKIWNIEAECVSKEQPDLRVILNKEYRADSGPEANAAFFTEFNESGLGEVLDLEVSRMTQGVDLTEAA